ncbi:hypothetical protein Tco_0555415 [Tanacetum coccineum]
MPFMSERGLVFIAGEDASRPSHAPLNPNPSFLCKFPIKLVYKIIWPASIKLGEFKEVQDDSSRSGNDTDADDADIRPIYDEEPMAEMLLRKESERYKELNNLCELLYARIQTTADDSKPKPRMQQSNIFGVCLYLW